MRVGGVRDVNEVGRSSHAEEETGLLVTSRWASKEGAEMNGEPISKVSTTMSAHCFSLGYG